MAVGARACLLCQLNTGYARIRWVRRYERPYRSEPSLEPPAMVKRSALWFGGMVATGLVAAGLWQCSLLRSQPPASDPPVIGAPAKGPRVVIIGFDGASYHLAKQFMDAGLMPNCKKLAESGTFAPP